MKIADNNQQEEYREFLKHIRAERQGTSNFAKLLFTIVLALLCAVIVCVTVLENSYFLNRLSCRFQTRHLLRQHFVNPLTHLPQMY